MNRQAFTLYEYLAPALLTPLSFWLWWRTYDGHLWLTLHAWLIPILYAYIVPAIGTNVLKVWEFNTRFRLGRFRPHHGFVFGSATATLAWLAHGGLSHEALDVLRLAFVFAAVLGFWNIVYDVRAIETGVLRVYNQPWAEGKAAAAIVLDYAPWFFGVFGGVYGAGLGMVEYRSAQGLLLGASFAWTFALILLCAISMPVLLYRRHAMRTHGHTGCRPVERKA